MRVGKRCGAVISALTLVVMLAGCDGRLVPVTAEFDRGFGFTFDSSFGTSVQVTLTQSDILGSLDIPDGATVLMADDVLTVFARSEPRRVLVERLRAQTD